MIDNAKTTWISRPCLISPKPTYLDLFCLGADRQLYYKAERNGKWEPSDSEWTILGGNFVSAPYAVFNSLGKVVVFCKGADDEICYMDMNLKERIWIPLGCAD